jgi:hypothetical protein
MHSTLLVVKLYCLLISDNELGREAGDAAAVEKHWESETGRSSVHRVAFLGVLVRPHQLVQSEETRLRKDAPKRSSVNRVPAGIVLNPFFLERVGDCDGAVRDRGGGLGIADRCS